MSKILVSSGLSRILHSGSSGQWWTNNGAIPAPVAAYRAVSTPGSVWGSGPTNLSESYVNLANPGTHNLSGLVNWSALTGWNGDGTNFLDTHTLIPSADHSFSAIACFERVADSGGTRALFGCETNSPSLSTVEILLFTSRVYGNGGRLIKGPYSAIYPVSTIGFANVTGYFDGGAETGTIPDTATTQTQALTLMACRTTSSGVLYKLSASEYLRAFWIANYNASAYMPMLHTIMMAL